MARTSYLPAMSVIERLVDSGMTHKEIADKISKDTGHRVARSTISVALARAGMAGDLPRYNDTVPWTVKVEHSAGYALRMLRALGRQRAGGTLSPEEGHRLAIWLKHLEEQNLVVAYCPDDPGPGVHYIDAQYGDAQGIPIRSKTLPLSAI